MAVNNCIGRNSRSYKKAPGHGYTPPVRRLRIAVIRSVRLYRVLPSHQNAEFPGHSCLARITPAEIAAYARQASGCARGY